MQDLATIANLRAASSKAVQSSACFQSYAQRPYFDCTSTAWHVVKRPRIWPGLYTSAPLPAQLGTEVWSLCTSGPLNRRLTVYIDSPEKQQGIGDVMNRTCDVALRGLEAAASSLSGTIHRIRERKLAAQGSLGL